MANTKLRSFRIPDDIYQGAQAMALLQGKSVSEILVAYLTAYGSSENQEAFKARNA